MCSNCSGDDLSPESFATFDVSSPNNKSRFAGGARKKRKRYGTIYFSTTFAQAALTLAIARMCLRRYVSRIIGTVDRASFVNLNLGASSEQMTAETAIDDRIANLIEIRVSADSIIEVYAASDPTDNEQRRLGLAERKYLSAWEESDAARNDLQRAMKGIRRIRRVKYFAACGAFLTFAALAVWCVVR
jgi:hypothetical protein